MSRFSAPHAPYRADTERRVRRNRYLGTAAGVLRRASQIMEQTTDATATAVAVEAVDLLDRALANPRYNKEPVLWLRRATLMQSNPNLADHIKQHAAERAVRMLELTFETDYRGLDIHHPMHLGCMMKLGLICEEQGRPDLTLRFLDVIEQLDPENDDYAESRAAIRERCTPISVPVYIPPPRPGMISPSAVPPALPKP